MRRLITLECSITASLLLLSVLSNSAATAANGTNHALPPLLTLISSRRLRPGAVQPPEEQPRAITRLAELAPLLVAGTLRAAKSTNTPSSLPRLFPNRHQAQPEVGPAPPRTPSRQFGIFYRVHTLHLFYFIILFINFVYLQAANVPREFKQCRQSPLGHLIKWIKSGVNSGVVFGVNTELNTKTPNYVN